MRRYWTNYRKHHFVLFEKDITSIYLEETLKKIDRNQRHRRPRVLGLEKKKAVYICLANGEVQVF